LNKDKPNVPISPAPVKSPDTGSGAPTQNDAGKKIFVEPELSNPVDVLEVTTFFQGATSGGAI
jgi:hypothetical protein